MKNECKNCGSTTRKLSKPGPRCATCFRVVSKQRRDKARDKHYTATYGISLEEYDRLYKFQEGTCYICRRATGKTKHLAVDHSHDTGEVRGLLCGPDNQLIGRARDNIDYFKRAIEYLEDPPYRRMKRLDKDKKLVYNQRGR